MTNFLGMRETEKTALFIDGANLYKAARALGFDMDYKSLLAKARSSSQLIRAYYYTAIQEDKEQDYSPLRPLVDWLDYNGYTMVTKMAREFTDATGKNGSRVRRTSNSRSTWSTSPSALTISFFFRQRRFQTGYRRHPVERRPGQRRVDDQIAAADGVGRIAASGRPLLRSRRP